MSLVLLLNGFLDTFLWVLSISPLQHWEKNFYRNILRRVLRNSENCSKLILHIFYRLFCCMWTCVVYNNYYFSIFNFELINFSKSIKYSQNFNEVIVVFSRWEKSQSSEGIPAIMNMDLLKIFPLSLTNLFFWLHEYTGCVSLFIVHSSMLINRFVLPIFK